MSMPALLPMCVPAAPSIPLPVWRGEVGTARACRTVIKRSDVHANRLVFIAFSGVVDQLLAVRRLSNGR